MGLNKSKGNMYEFITHTWNTIKGECPHNCSYCYVNRWGKKPKLHFDEKELKTDLGKDNFIFVGSSCDMFAESIEPEWVIKTLEHCKKFDNQYLFQSKNPKFFDKYSVWIPKNVVFCTTIESNRWYPEVMKNSPHPEDRAKAMASFAGYVKTYVTIEPIMDFDVMELVKLIKMCRPEQVNIGADSGNNHLPEPSKTKLLDFINELKFQNITIHKKTNLKRLLK
jgi:DNA repair photolyase